MIRLFFCKYELKKSSGMTLLELIVVLAVLGTLVLLALPTYSQHTLNNHRVKAMSDLMLLQLRIETLNTSKDREIVIEEGYCSAGIPCQSDRGRFHFSVIETNDEYILQVKSIGHQTTDKCPVLSISSNGKKEPLECWK
ncbi:type IV pilin protein [Vibrio hannami]|uniref:type IV pilin protein n=1 Tax=Vibrio hannami TaxID=2717094 RepID=UPI00240FE9EA|nr:type IV pilin protein [Vibrio hannami]MDG3087300.1 type IV pilin protein [Vibrio hannami]